MEWYYRSDVDDLVVPEDLDDFPQSPDNWSQWDTTAFGNFKSERKNNDMRLYNPAKDSKLIRNALSDNNVDNATTGQDLNCDWNRWSSYPSEQQDFNLDSMASIDQLDDMFLSSLLEECPNAMDAFDESSKLSTNPEHGTSNTCSAGSAKHFSQHAFTSTLASTKALSSEIDVEMEHNRMDNGVSDEELSMEESVLEHLESLTSQLTDEARICFRDALYRLADNSKHEMCQNRNIIPDQTSKWLNKEDTTELRTNAIDRTVANLLFSNIEFGVPGGSSMDIQESPT